MRDDARITRLLVPHLKIALMAEIKPTKAQPSKAAEEDDDEDDEDEEDDEE